MHIICILCIYTYVRDLALCVYIYIKGKLCNVYFARVEYNVFQ